MGGFCTSAGAGWEVGTAAWFGGFCTTAAGAGWVGDDLFAERLLDRCSRRFLDGDASLLISWKHTIWNRNRGVKKIRHRRIKQNTNEHNENRWYDMMTLNCHHQKRMTSKCGVRRLKCVADTQAAHVRLEKRSNTNSVTLLAKWAFWIMQRTRGGSRPRLFYFHRQPTVGSRSHLYWWMNRWHLTTMTVGWENAERNGLKKNPDFSLM